MRVTCRAGLLILGAGVSRIACCARCLPSAEELAALPHGELAARLAEAYRLISELSERLERLERRAGAGFGDVVEAAVVRQPV